MTWYDADKVKELSSKVEYLQARQNHFLVMTSKIIARIEDRIDLLARREGRIDFNLLARLEKDMEEVKDAISDFEYDIQELRSQSDSEDPEVVDLYPCVLCGLLTIHDPCNGLSCSVGKDRWFSAAAAERILGKKVCECAREVEL